jgi:hypothetical protein
MGFDEVMVERLGYVFYVEIVYGPLSDYWPPNFTLYKVHLRINDQSKKGKVEKVTPNYVVKKPPVLKETFVPPLKSQVIVVDDEEQEKSLVHAEETLTDISVEKIVTNNVNAGVGEDEIVNENEVAKDRRSKLIQTGKK